MNARKLFLSLNVMYTCQSFTFQSTTGTCRSLSRPDLVSVVSRQDRVAPLFANEVDKDVNSDDDDDVYGAKFFGGNQVKELVFDEKEEKEGVDRIMKEVEMASYNRFDDRDAFESELARNLASRLQMEINDIVACKNVNEVMVNGDSSSIYGSSLVWDTPFEKSGSISPLGALREAAQFYNKVDVAIISGNFKSNTTAELQWEISLIWPNMWEAKVTFSGISMVVLNKSGQIIKQHDLLEGYEGTDVLKAVSDQYFPRFWDFVNVGMSPSAEMMPRVTTEKKAFSSYSVFEIPPRVVLRPSLIDRSGREARNAQMLPMHSFTSAIITSGPARDFYSTTSPIEVAIKPSKLGNGESYNRIEWTVPIAVELAKQTELPLPVEESDDLVCNYEYQQRRRVATVTFAGDPQDEGVTKARKQLFEAVNKDGLTPRVDETGRPIFFFLQNESKACFTESGLGMAIYESRPGFGKKNEVGIELEL